MTHSPLLRRLLLVCLATALAVAPAAARAQEPEDPNTLLGPGNPCFDTAEVEGSLALPDAESEDELVFDGLPDCPKLCKKAGLACAKHAKLAGTCESRWADDRARFAIKVTCAGKKGTELKECVGPIEEHRLEERETAKTRQQTEITACLARGESCGEKCVAAP